jgi:hypothetical protein
MKPIQQRIPCGQAQFIGSFLNGGLTKVPLAIYIELQDVAFLAGQAKPKGRFPRMITRKQQRAAQKRAAQMIRNSGVGIKEEEPKKIEVVDFGLSNLEEEGVQVL